MVYDVAIIGTGPAGLSAAVTLKLRDKSVIWFGDPEMSGKVQKSEKIANYPGLGLVTGKELNARFRSHAAELGLEIRNQMVTTVFPMGNTFSLAAGSDVFEAKTILLATGVASEKGFPGEAEFLGRGVSYCATCDGFLYRGKTIGIFCQDVRFEPEVDYLAGLADRVYVAAPYRGGKYGRPEENSGSPGDKGNVERLTAGIRALTGQMKVNALTLTNGTEVAVDGFFCLRNAIAPATLLSGIALEGPHIVVDREMRTSVKGVYAAGDCTGRPYQIAKAVGEGNIAAHTILEDLA